MKAIILLATSLLVSCNQQTSTEAVEANKSLTTPSTDDMERPAAKAASSKPNYDDQGKQFAWIERGKDAIRAKLRDPGSAEFRNVEFHSGGGVPMACGEVNANNGFGGKDGFERFISAGTTMAVLESEMTSVSDMSQVWDRYCIG